MIDSADRKKMGMMKMKNIGGQVGREDLIMMVIDILIPICP